jgi:hypothetical protein
MNLNLPAGKLIDISLPLDARTFHMRTYSGFKKDMQFDVEVIKEYEDGGYGQIVRGAHMRLHAGTRLVLSKEKLRDDGLNFYRNFDYAEVGCDLLVYPRDQDRSTIAYTVELVEVSYREVVGFRAP